MRWLKLVLILFILNIEVRVHAETTTHTKVLKTESTYLEQNQLLEGSLWVRKTKKYSVETPYGEVQSQFGDFYISYEKPKVRVVNHAGILVIQLKDGQRVEVPPGFELWFSEIQEDKTNAMGFIQPVEVKDHIVTLGKLYDKSAKELKNELLTMQERWGDRTVIAANYYKSLAQRKIASIEEKKSYQRDLKKQEEDRRNANRKLLYDHAFGR